MVLADYESFKDYLIGGEICVKGTDLNPANFIVSEEACVVAVPPEVVCTECPDFLIEQDLGVFNFVEHKYSGFCDFVSKGDCKLYHAVYNTTLEGVKKIDVGVETHTEAFY